MKKQQHNEYYSKATSDIKRRNNDIMNITVKQHLISNEETTKQRHNEYYS